MRDPFSHKVTKSGWCVIDDRELFNLANKVGSYEIALLILLKKKGAPISGIVNLKPDFDNFNWQREDTFYQTNFKWECR